MSFVSASKTGGRFVGKEGEVVPSVWGQHRELRANRRRTCREPMVKPLSARGPDKPQIGPYEGEIGLGRAGFYTILGRPRLSWPGLSELILGRGFPGLRGALLVAF